MRTNFVKKGGLSDKLLLRFCDSCASGQGPVYKAVALCERTRPLRWAAFFDNMSYYGIPWWEMGHGNMFMCSATTYDGWVACQSKQGRTVSRGSRGRECKSTSGLVVRNDCPDRFSIAQTHSEQHQRWWSWKGTAHTIHDSLTGSNAPIVNQIDKQGVL